MLFDPRRGLAVSLVALALCLVWFLALAVADDVVWAHLGMGMHPITFLAIVVALSALVSAAFFRRMTTVRAELLAGDRVLATWRVDPATFAAFAPEAVAEALRDKRQVLWIIWSFVAVIFGAFALLDPDAAPTMLTIGAGLAATVGLAFLLGGRAMRRQWTWRDGEVIVGERGLLFNGVLHVWGLPLTRLTTVERIRDPGSLVVGYAWVARTGVQSTSVTLPIVRDAQVEADHAFIGLRHLLEGRHERRRRRRSSSSRDGSRAAAPAPVPPPAAPRPPATPAPSVDGR